MGVPNRALQTWLPNRCCQRIWRQIWSTNWPSRQGRNIFLCVHVSLSLPTIICCLVVSFHTLQLCRLWLDSPSVVFAAVPLYSALLIYSVFMHYFIYSHNGFRQCVKFVWIFCFYAKSHTFQAFCSAFSFRQIGMYMHVIPKHIPSYLMLHSERHIQVGKAWDKVAIIVVSSPFLRRERVWYTCALTDLSLLESDVWEWE